MEYLVDTGVLLRLFDRSDSSHAIIRQCLRKLRAEGHRLITSSQNIAEFWNVSRGLTLEEAVSEFRAYEAELRTIQSKLDKAEEQYARGEAKPIDKDAFLADVNRRLDERGIPN